MYQGDSLKAMNLLEARTQMIQIVSSTPFLINLRTTEIVMASSNLNSAILS